MSEIPSQLIDTLNDVSRRQQIPKEDKEFIKKNLIFLQDFVNEDETEIMDPIIESLEKGRLTDNDRSVILRNKKFLIQIINTYEEEFNVESNEDKIDEEKGVDDVERELDAKVNKYNGFDQQHPMQGISYMEIKKKWRIQTKTCTTSTNNLDLATQKIINSTNFEKIEKNRVKKFFPYQNHYFMTYWYDRNPLFDIQHIISVHNLKTTSYAEKYNEFSKQITRRAWHQNEFGGYILRELIPRSTVFEIMLSSNSTISKSFKKDVSKILDELSNDGDLIITNDAVTIKKPKQRTNVDEEKDTQIQILFDKKLALSYDNPYDMSQLYLLINQMSYQPIGSFVNRSVLYAFIVTIKRDHNNVIVKFGWSLDILERITKLQSDFGSNFYLIGIKCVKNEPVEKNFHKVLQHKFPDSIEPIKIKGKNKKELYKFNLLMMTEFDAVESYSTQNIQDIYLTDGQKLLVESIRYQHIVFQDINMSQINLNNIMTKTNDKNVLNNCAVLHYQFLTTQSNNTHNQYMIKMRSDDDKLKCEFNLKEVEINKELRLKEFEIKEMEIKKELRLKELEIRSKELDIENYKLKHNKK